MSKKKGKNIASLEIKNCRDCPFLQMDRNYTADSFETEFNWFCKNKDGKKIAGAVAWNEEKDVEVPDWCPILK